MKERSEANEMNEENERTTRTRERRERKNDIDNVGCPSVILRNRLEANTP
jgi:hypothetical protein